MGPREMGLQELEQSQAIRWVDLFAGDLANSEALALLGPICHGELTARMARDLVTPRRFPAGRQYPGTEVSITAAFRTRHLQGEGTGQGDGVVTSVFEPMHLLIGGDWLLTCWLPPRVFRGGGAALDESADDGDVLYRAVAEIWTETDGETAGDLADLVRRQLAVAAGYRLQARS
jgi:hypothetical protein